MVQSALKTSNERWLRTLYFTRAAFSVVWVILMFRLAGQSPQWINVLLVIYPAWDALANVVDAKKSGGLHANPTQAFNVALSTVTAIAMCFAVGSGLSSVFVVFGVWALLSGLLQLGTALRRWKHAGAQWPMVLSGAQSALAGVFFVVQAGSDAAKVQALAGYSAVGALYFLISACFLHFRLRSERSGIGSQI